MLSVDAQPFALRNLVIRGLRRSKDELVRDTIALEAGDPISFGRIARAQRRLYDLGVFRSVDKPRYDEMINEQIEQATKGNKARIRAKMNSLEDREIITALYRAADAGVEILLNVRGICCLVPRKNIQVISIVDQYLEHMRILAFHHEGAKKVFITSADAVNHGCF